MIYVDSERCTGCGVCLELCPTGAITLPGQTAVIEESLCRGCAHCLEGCPQGAILSVEVVAPAARPLAVPLPAPAPAAAPPARLQPAPLSLRDWALPAVGSALLWTGREILPRLASLALGWLDRRSHPTGRALLVDQPAPTRSQILPRQAGGRGRHRRRRRNGRRA